MIRGATVKKGWIRGTYDTGHAASESIIKGRFGYCDVADE